MRREAYTDDGSVRRRGVGPTGALLMLLGIWAGFIPFVGPYFNYQMQTTKAWDMTNDHFWLSVLPAIAIFVGGWMIARAFRSGTASLGGLLAFAGSFWLVIGPHFAALWKNGQVGGGPAFGGTGVQVGEWLGFFYAAGALGILLSGYAMGYFAALPHLFGRRTAATTGAAAGGTAATTTTADPGTGAQRVGPDGYPVERERISDTRATAPATADPAATREERV